MLRFDRVDHEGYPDYTVTARVGRSTVVNDLLHFDRSERERFLSEFVVFERTRRGIATLSAEPDFRMEIVSDGPAGGAWVSVRLQRHLVTDVGATGSKSGLVTIEFGLPLLGELVAAKLREFYVYFDAAQGA